MQSLKQLVILGSLVMLSLGVNAYAATAPDNTIDDLDDPLTVEFRTTLDADTLKGGEPFTAVLKEDVSYNGQILPAGTTFYGHVASARSSKPFFRKGYLTFEIDKAVFPGGVAYDFDAERFSQNVKKIHASNDRGFLKKNLPMSIVSMGTSIPLRVATSLSSGIIFPIALGARMAYGVVDEVFISDEHANETASARAGHGIVRATGIPTAVEVLRGAPSPTIAAGDTGKLYVNPDWLGGLFSASESMNVLMQAPEPAPQAAPEPLP